MRRIVTMWIVCLGLFGGQLLSHPALALQPQAQAPAAAEPQKVTFQDITLLAKSDLSDETTVAFLESRELDFTIDAPVLAELREQGVSEGVIQFLVKKSRQPESLNERVVYVSTTPYPSWYDAYPSWYFSFYYSLDARHYGHSLSSTWVHGLHGSGGHSLAANFYAHSGLYSTHDEGRRHTSSRHRSAGHSQQGHAGNATIGHDIGSGHSVNSDHSGGRHSRRNHSGRSHGRSRHGGGHRGGGHGGGHGGGGH